MEYEKITIGDKAYRLMPEGDYQSPIEQSKRTRTGYERVDYKGCFYSSRDGVKADYHDAYDKEYYADGDYLNDLHLYEDNESAIKIYRRMLQWQALNDDAVDIYNPSALKYFIYYNAATKSLIIDSVVGKIGSHTVYFSTYAKAQKALEVFRDDLIWLHTKYRRRLDEPIRD